MARIEYPEVLEAVTKANRSQWTIGDALRKEIAIENDGRFRADNLRGGDGLGPQFVACSAMLAERGFDQYSETYLSRLRSATH